MFDITHLFKSLQIYHIIPINKFDKNYDYLVFCFFFSCSWMFSYLCPQLFGELGIWDSSKDPRPVPTQSIWFDKVWSSYYLNGTKAAIDRANLNSVPFQNVPIFYYYSMNKLSCCKKGTKDSSDNWLVSRDPRNFVKLIYTPSYFSN